MTSPTVVMGPIRGMINQTTTPKRLLPPPKFVEMPPTRLISLLSFALSIGIVASYSPSPEVTLSSRNVYGSSSVDPLDVLGRAFSNVRNQKRDFNLQASTSLEKSWNDAVLFKLYVFIRSLHVLLFVTHAECRVGEAQGEVSANISVEVTCVTCYLRGIIPSSLSACPGP